jgi:DNA-binding LacI/PurR family transcriptional regulator
MARAQPRKSSPRPAGGRPPPADALAARLRQLLAAAPADQPLPTTRELGERWSVANTTIYRVLQRLTEAGELWQHPSNGRYFPASARLLLNRPKPIACLLRRLELGSELYRELLEGISAGCGANGRTMLLWHDALLVNHADPQHPPVFATAEAQGAILHDFLARHGDSAGGFILDHVWSDTALRTHLGPQRPAVVLFRGCALESVGNVRADFRAGALKALGYLLGRGYETVVPTVPFDGDPAVDEFAGALQAAAAELGCPERVDAPARASTPAERAALIKRLRHSRRRLALLCPEDNVATLLLSELREAGLSCPRDVGVLSVMGTDFATRAGLSCLRYDFRALGRAAVEALGAEPCGRRTLEPVLSAGEST